LISVSAFTQSPVDKFLDSTFKALKATHGIDKSDMKVYELLDAFYDEALQSDAGEVTPSTRDRVHAYMDNEKALNKHLLILFLMYQEHVGDAAKHRRAPNPEFQVATIKLVEKEFESIYQKVPAIVYIYKAEALGGAGKDDEANAVVQSALKKYPNSIPLKVYSYMDTKSESMRKDLINNHSKHWMVQLMVK
jgi:hypothetical protein